MALVILGKVSLKILVTFCLQIVLTIMTVTCYLGLTAVRGLPTAADDHRSLKSDANQTHWTIIPSKVGHEKSHRKRPGCKPYPRAKLVQMFIAIAGSRSYDGYNPRYMAFNWEEARKFPNLVANASASLGKVSYIPNLPFRPSTRPSILPASPEHCITTEGGCIECRSVRDLGRSRIPRYINEVTCKLGICKGLGGIGICQSAKLNQLFLRRTGKCDPQTGYEEVIPYMQEIRVCCKCMILP